MKHFYEMTALEQQEYFAEQKAEGQRELLKKIDNAFEAIYDLQKAMKDHEYHMEINMREYVKSIEETEIKLGEFEKEVEAA